MILSNAFIDLSDCKLPSEKLFGRDACFNSFYSFRKPT